MTGYEVRIDGAVVEPAPGWRLAWVDRRQGIARLTNGATSLTVVVEGARDDWYVVLRGRRLPVSVRTRREQLLAEAAVAAQGHGGPTEVRATLPGLVVAIAVEEGSEVAEGDGLLTLEAMKMQNEVRAPRAGRVESIAVEAGRAVATGELLIRLA